MPNPWDRPPIPNQGDVHEDITYTHVGRLLSLWEAIEFELSRLYTVFGGKLDDQMLMNEYGKGTIFVIRAQALEKVADSHFVSTPDQKREAEFSELLYQTYEFSKRRNDVGHGIVFRIDSFEFFRQRIEKNLLKRQHFALIPPLYAFRFADDSGFPLFAYTSEEMTTLALHLETLGKRIVRFRCSL